MQMRSASNSPGKELPVTWTEGWMITTGGLDAAAKRKITFLVPY